MQRCRFRVPDPGRSNPKNSLPLRPAGNNSPPVRKTETALPAIGRRLPPCGRALPERRSVTCVAVETYRSVRFSDEGVASIGVSPSAAQANPSVPKQVHTMMQAAASAAKRPIVGNPNLGRFSYSAVSELAPTLSTQQRATTAVVAQPVGQCRENSLSAMILSNTQLSVADQNPRRRQDRHRLGTSRKEIAQAKRPAAPPASFFLLFIPWLSALRADRPPRPADRMTSRPNRAPAPNRCRGPVRPADRTRSPTLAGPRPRPS